MDPPTALRREVSVLSTVYCMVLEWTVLDCIVLDSGLYCVVLDTVLYSTTLNCVQY